MFSNHQSPVKKFSISDAAIAYRKPRCTIMRYVRSGAFELDYNNLIDYSQLVKRFGELSSSIPDEKDQKIQQLKSEISHLKKQMNQKST